MWRQDSLAILTALRASLTREGPLRIAVGQWEEGGLLGFISFVMLESASAGNAEEWGWHSAYCGLHITLLKSRLAGLHINWFRSRELQRRAHLILQGYRDKLLEWRRCDWLTTYNCHTIIRGFSREPKYAQKETAALSPPPRDALLTRPGLSEPVYRGAGSTGISVCGWMQDIGIW